MLRAGDGEMGGSGFAIEPDWSKEMKLVTGHHRGVRPHRYTPSLPAC
jgi:hypothetical protein